MAAEYSPQVEQQLRCETSEHVEVIGDLAPGILNLMETVQNGQETSTVYGLQSGGGRYARNRVLVVRSGPEDITVRSVPGTVNRKGVFRTRRVRTPMGEVEEPGTTISLHVNPAEHTVTLDASTAILWGDHRYHGRHALRGAWKIGADGTPPRYSAYSTTDGSDQRELLIRVYDAISTAAAITRALPVHPPSSSWDGRLIDHAADLGDYYARYHEPAPSRNLYSLRNLLTNVAHAVANHTTKPS